MFANKTTEILILQKYRGLIYELLVGTYFRGNKTMKAVESLSSLTLCCIMLPQDNKAIFFTVQTHG